MAQQLEKAQITALAGNIASAGPIDVLFNPAEYTYEISNNFQETSLPGLSNPILQFVNGQTQVLSMELLFDQWTDRSGANVAARVKQLADLLAIDPDLHAPPPVEFSWGTFSFKAVIESLSQRFTMFDADGTPVRATASISFKQYRPLNEQLENPRLESSDKTKLRSLDGAVWALAAREYGDPNEWRRIARENRISNPRMVPQGTSLLVPPKIDDETQRT